MKIMRTVYHAILKRMDPIDYAKRVGVNFPGGGLHIYGRVSWNTEPWLITLGNNKTNCGWKQRIHWQ